MRRLRGWLARLGGLFRRDHHDRELSAELESHLRFHIEDNLHAGMTPEAARREALMKLGGIEQTKQIYRERGGLPFLETFLHDLRYSCRTLRKEPGFTLVAVLTLSLGIALNASIFSLLSAFLLRRPPGHDPDRVAVISSVSPASSSRPDAYRVSPPNYLAWRDANQVFTEIAAADTNHTVNLSSDGQPESVAAAAISLNYFAVLGVDPQFGRTFATGEDQPGRDHVVILSHDLWVRRYGSDPTITSRTIRLNRSDYSVVGVMPESFQMMGFPLKLWIPLVLNSTDQTAAAHRNRSLRLFARFKPNATLEQARAEFTSLARRAEQDSPETEKGWGASVRTLPDFLIYDFQIRGALAILMTTVGFVMLIACANVAGLFLARSTHRLKELAVRMALGAGRLRIVRQSLTESLLVCLLGGGAGLVLARWSIEFLRAHFDFNEAVRAVPIALDGNVMGYAFGISLLSALLCGLVPALNASRTDVNSNLKQESRSASGSSSRSRLRRILVTAEVALALVLLVGTGLLIRAIFLIEHQDLGFRAEQLLTGDIALDADRYKSASEQSLFARDALRQLQQIPGAEAVAFASDLPATGARSVPVQIKGQPELPADQRQSALDYVITPDYFEAAGVSRLRGRTFTQKDDASSPRVALVNEEFVRRFLPNQEPLGRQIRLDLNGAAPEWREIVGVVPNLITYSEERRYDPAVFEPFLQRPLPSFSLVIRAAGEPTFLASAARSAIAQLDSELPVARVMSMPALIDLQKGGDMVFSQLLAAFAILALVLAAIGIYGLIAYSVNQRTHEIGIRMSLGAGRADVLRMVLVEGLKITALGGGLGLLLALPLPKVFESMFFGIHLREPIVYVVVPTTLLAVALLATYIPARRATRVDPIRALRQE
jgi:putative ABC transport system permease protein